jgi:cytosine/adenosine deaminase-related metal-dependent hydrolase
MIRTIHRAKYVFAEADLLLPDAAVHVSVPGRISRVEPWPSGSTHLDAEVIDWGSALILPGLVNAHTHLELTRLHGQLTNFTSFTDWVSQLIRIRQPWTREEYVQSTRQGAKMALAAGTTLVGDVSASGASWEALKLEKLRKVVFEEVRSPVPELAAEKILELEQQLDSIRTDELLSIGISPHAPYSVSEELYLAAYALARRRGLLLALHVAETEGEVEFLLTGTGEFEKFLMAKGVLVANWKPPGLAPITYFEKLKILHQPALLIHCNYLDKNSMAIILRSRSSVVYCPRSHAFFGHKKHPVRELMDLGVNVALGTDSLASNDSLSILDEMRFLFEKRRDLRTDEIFRMATLNGAAALGFQGFLGRLRRGHWADLTIVDLPNDPGPKNLTTQILEGAGEIVATVVRGEIAWKRQ